MTLVDISLEIGDQPILRQASLALEPEERVCLIGRNGAGKSTLMRIITGEQAIDAGEIHMRQDLRISQLEQELPALLDITVYEYVADGLSHLQQLINEYQAAAAAEPSEQSLRDMEHLQRRIEAEGGWNIDKQIERTLTDLKLPAERKLSELSGGWRRRVSLAKALVSNPELLLLDEPTNHLDLSTIQWLEDRIRGFAGSVLFITHDRAFLQRLATRIVEIDRTRLSSWPGDYRNFLRRKEEAMEAEAREQQLFQKKLEEEEVWIRQGIKARRTRNEGRVRALEALRNEAEERHKLKPTDKARITIEEADASGRKVIEMHNVHYRYNKNDAHELISGLSLKIMRGDRIGLVGNNGVGKSTLLRMMLGELLPDAGTVKLGTNLAIGYFDQLRRELDPDRTIADVVGNGKDFIRMNGKDRHVIGYLRGFLFSAKRAMTKVGVLSGGERNRVILARLFTKPSNFLILDEPTNDLDVETLEVLEDRLMEYPGTMIVVSHDREFLDNVVSSVLVFEEGGKIEHYIGGFSDWQRRGRKLHETDNPNSANNSTGAGTVAHAPASPRKLSYKFQRELELLPEKMSAAEQRVARLQQQVGAPDFYNQSFAEIQPVLDELADAERALNALLERWVALEDMQKP